ncbi:ABC transporter permease [Bifidobacterium olomucense]|uniref:ABC transporter permease n=1 Tax=Bifidobacterium olomucense TaxID=2675324 RepID=A0A7Y0EXT6_9BIFI|nr:ABC transporter permease [Bifidobacterium sp. DSM 109959]NMM98393.1 ABC transporter permease [Bifidobacterium sp. DSM 109959]
MTSISNAKSNDQAGVWQRLIKLPIIREIAESNGAQRGLIVTGLSFIVLFVLVALFAPLLAPYGFAQLKGADGATFGVLEAPSAVHPLGTTSTGYDVLSRVLWGSRTALLAVCLGVVLPIVIGVPLGALSGYFRGPLDKVLVTISDAIYVFPTLLLAIVVSLVISGGQAGMWPGLLSAAVALSVVYIPQYFRVVRTEVSRLSSEGFVEAGRAMGAGDLWVLFHEALPNALRTVPLIMTLNAGDAVMTLASLGFLGFGIEPTAAAEWGYDLNKSMNDVSNGVWWTAICPGVAIIIIVLGFTLFGEGVNDVADPRSRKAPSIAKLLKREQTARGAASGAAAKEEAK